jgi:hypothetical protein
MFLSRGVPPLLVPPFYSHLSVRNVSSARTTQLRLGLIPKKKRGPKSRVYTDPEDPTKVVKRTQLINFRPRGPTTIPTKLRSTASTVDHELT